MEGPGATTKTRDTQMNEYTITTVTFHKEENDDRQMTISATITAQSAQAALDIFNGKDPGAEQPIA